MYEDYEVLGPVLLPGAFSCRGCGAGSLLFVDQPFSSCARLDVFGLMMPILYPLINVYKNDGKIHHAITVMGKKPHYFDWAIFDSKLFQLPEGMVKNGYTHFFEVFGRKLAVCFRFGFRLDCCSAAWGMTMVELDPNNFSVRGGCSAGYFQLHEILPSGKLT